MRDGVRPGQLSDASCFSFYATKNMTCGEGGAIAVNDTTLTEKLRLLRLHGMTKTAADREREGYQHWDMVELGWKYNMDNIQAALLLPQLERLERNWQKRRALVERYSRGLDGIPGVRRPATHASVKHAHHLFPIWVEPALRDATILELQRRKIGIVVNYRAIHLLTWFREHLGFKPGIFPNAEHIGDSTLSLPLYPTMPLEQVDRVIQSIRDYSSARRMAA
jgi:dTDP-4-amino-4,6-dideoxygalactose transaminase